MTRKDYIVLAAAIRRAALKNWHTDVDGSYPAALKDQHTTYVREVAYALAADNKNFDWERFVKACDPEGGD